MDADAQARAPHSEGGASREAAAQLGQEMRRLHKLISSRVLLNMQDELQDHDLSFTQMAALHQLRARAPLTVTALSECARLSLPAASHLVERLVRRGLAERRENPDNRREKLVVPTAQGLDIVTRMDGQFTEAYVSALSSVPAEKVRAASTAIHDLLTDLAPSQENA